MSRVIVLALLLLGTVLVAHDCSLLVDRLNELAPSPLNMGKVAVALVCQCAALIFSGWYALFLTRRARLAATHSAAAFKLSLLPFVAPILLLIAGTTLLEIGLFCGEQSLNTRSRGGQVCPGR